MIKDRIQYNLFGRVIFEIVEINSPFKIPNPVPDEACFLYLLEGNIHYSTMHGDIEVNEKDAVLLKCGNYFSRLRYPNSSGSQRMIVVHFHPEMLKKIYNKDLPKFLNNRDDAKRDQISSIKSDLLIQKYIEGLLFYFENPGFINDEIMILKVKEILLLLTQTKNGPVIERILSQLFSPSQYTFKQLIEDHLYSNLSLEELSGLGNMSISSFKREFKKVYNDSPANYIRNKKLEKATELLTMSEERITDIAFDCGFNDLAHFSKCFSDRFGTSPSSFRMDQNRIILDFIK